MTKKKKRTRKARPSPLAWLRRGAQATAFLAIAAFLGSIVWTAVYRVAPAPGTILMAERRLQGEAISYRWTPLSRISPNLVRAVIAAEDTRFCAHNGFDVKAIRKAIDAAENGDRLRGASTISQQTSKNAFLWPGRGWVRKGIETWFTVVQEAFWSKRRTMEMYLNVAEWGDGLFGAEAAAQARFGESAADLTPYQAALLAAVLPNPNKWRVDPPGPYVRKRTSTVLARMRVVRRDGLDACVLN